MSTDFMDERDKPSRLTAAAWVPDDDPHRPWEDAAHLAVEWIHQRSEDEGVAPLVVTNTQAVDLPASLAAIADHGGRATPQGKARFERGPVVVYVPDARSLRFAMDLARGFSLAAVESVSFSLAEWAAGVEAVNLLDGTVSTAALAPDVIRDLDSAVFFGGRNGWTGSHEKDHARRHLAEHVNSGALTPIDATSYVMSQGVSDRGAQSLQALLERIHGRMK